MMRSPGQLRLQRLQRVFDHQRAYTDEVQRLHGKVVPFVFHRTGRPINFRRTAVRNLERAGVSRSVAMRLVGHETEAIYRRYAITTERDLAEGVAKLQSFDEKNPRNTVLPLRADKTG